MSSALDLIVHQARLRDGSRRITHVTEVVGMEGEVITLQDLYVFQHAGTDAYGRVQGTLKPTGLPPGFLEKFTVAGVPWPPGRPA